VAGGSPSVPFGVGFITTFVSFAKEPDLLRLGAASDPSSRPREGPRSSPGARCRRFLGAQPAVGGPRCSR
jgi:hypothetical protein